MLHVLVADDHGIVRSGLKMLIERQEGMRVVAEAEDGVAAVEAALREQPDVAVLDVSMPRMTGVQAAREIKARCPETSVVLLSMHDEERYLFDGLKAGASGYVLKKAAAEELVKAIRVVAAGGVFLDPALAGKVVNGYVGRKKMRGALQGSALSEREEEVLRLVAWGYTNKEVAGYLNISVKTVETHKTNLMEKLDLNGRSDIVRYALRRGWLHEI